MSLKHVLLGLLAERPRTGYDLKQALDGELAGLWGADQSQIYRTLAALARDGLVTRHTVVQTDRPSQHPHEITDSGRRELADWLAEPPEPAPELRDPLLLRLWFLGRSSGGRAQRALASRRAELAAQEEELAPGDWPRGADAAAALRYAARARRLAHLRTELAWIDATEQLLDALPAPETAERASESGFPDRDKGKRDSGPI